MQTTISSKHIDITPAITQYAQKKTERLERYYDRIQQIDVIIDKARNGYVVEIITDVERHKPFVATAEDADMYACIDLGVDRASRQLKDHKSRLRNNKHITANGHPTGPAGGTRGAGMRKASARMNVAGRTTARRAGSRGK